MYVFLSLQVEYETLPGWESDISKVREWDQLPLAARNYVQHIEDLAGVPIKWIGVGPGRDAIVIKPEMKRTVGKDDAGNFRY